MEEIPALLFLKRWLESLIILMSLSVAYVYIAFLFIRKYKSKEEVRFENEQRITKYEEDLKFQEIEFYKKIAEYENAKKLEEDQKNRITGMKNKALQEFPNYFIFQNHVLNQFSPERFRIKNL